MTTYDRCAVCRRWQRVEYVEPNHGGDQFPVVAWHLAPDARWGCDGSWSEPWSPAPTMLDQVRELRTALAALGRELLRDLGVRP